MQLLWWRNKVLKYHLVTPEKFFSKYQHSPEMLNTPIKCCNIYEILDG